MSQMDEKKDGVILCAASKYEEKYYLNPDFEGMPTAVKNELQAMCVLFTEDIGGILTLEFDVDGNLDLVTMANEDDILYDDIGCGLKIRQLRLAKQELFEALELYYRVVFLGEQMQ